MKVYTRRNSAVFSLGILSDDVVIFHHQNVSVTGLGILSNTRKLSVYSLKVPSSLVEPILITSNLFRSQNHCIRLTFEINYFKCSPPSSGNSWDLKL